MAVGGVLTTIGLLVFRGMEVSLGGKEEGGTLDQNTHSFNAEALTLILYPKNT